MLYKILCNSCLPYSHLYYIPSFVHHKKNTCILFYSILSRQLDEADSCSPRSLMTITGLQKSENDETNEEDGLNVISAIVKEAGIDENNFRKHVGKIHPIGGAKNGNQARIIKFTTHSYEEKVFLQHKRNKKNYNGKKKKNPKT